MAIIAGIASGVIIVLLIAGLLFGAATVTAKVSAARKKRQEANTLAALPFEQQKYAEFRSGIAYWYDPESGYDTPWKFTNFDEFKHRVEVLYGKTLDTGPEIDTTEPEDPFALDGGFLNANDLDEEESTHD